MHNFIPQPPADDAPSSSARGPIPAHSLASKQWTRDYRRLDNEAVITGSELACTDPGCPLIETVIAVFDASGSRKWKLTRPKSAVTKIMVQQALATPPLP